MGKFACSGSGVRALIDTPERLPPWFAPCFYMSILGCVCLRRYQHGV